VIRVSHPALPVLWGKSDAEGKVHLLIAHLLDAAAVGERLWDTYLAPVTRARLDACFGGRGRQLLALLCALHDVGKATPAFQDKEPTLAKRVREAGLTWDDKLSGDARQWHHASAGAWIIRDFLKKTGWPDDAINFVWPMIAGHHGLIPPLGEVKPCGAQKRGHGTGPQWQAAQEAVIEAVIDALGVDLDQFVPARMPTRADQLAIAGLVVMADWIASGSGFPGIDDIADVSMGNARQRARDALTVLGIRGGWGQLTPPSRDEALDQGREETDRAPDLIAQRFGRPARPAQRAAVALAERLPGPGLIMVEAPMGEGKTELSLAVTEVLARRFGADGLLVGMPTQATSDPMFTRVRAWAGAIRPDLPVGLLHGKRRFNKEWRALRKRRFANVNEDGRAPGTDDHDLLPAEWFFGPHRSLLIRLTVGTIDHLLHAATRTRFVMLRHAGLAGRVVVLDEIHAYDVYTSEFICEALRWLGSAGIPVVLLSATLPPPLRAELLAAYVEGAGGTAGEHPDASSATIGYPVIRAVGVTDGRTWSDATTAAPWRTPTEVRVETIEEGPADGPEAVVHLLRDALADGGCALVIRNTVGRAQQTYRAIKAALGDDVILLHARLTIGDRADRTEQVLRQLGAPESGHPRPRRLVVVATQLAEQSFDVDADLLVTDLAPIDLLLQRTGRIHRHARPETDRPARVRTPRVVVAGMRTGPDGVPIFPVSSEGIYSRYALLRAAALVRTARDGGGWLIPTAVPELVALGYGDEPITPAEWAATVAEARAARAGNEEKRRSRAEPFLLAGKGRITGRSLAGLHRKDTDAPDAPDDDDAVGAVVRDGPETIEVVLVRQDEQGYHTLEGRPLGPDGAATDEDTVEAILRSSVRLPARADRHGRATLTPVAKKELRPLPGWATDSWLRRVRALVLNPAGEALLGGRRLTYHPELGLVDEPAH
jgi:CRISPR-associated endonuclease/helicase Cas3